ncbi:MAG: HK97 gp10 family phage protein [Candidatus Microbacterium colombiense]|nr:MAG: HK97 gp10 family phage protein [Microbacterium sp.]
MAKNTRFEENPRFFETVLRKPGVERLVDDIGDATLTNAQAAAPVDTQAYRNGLHVEHHESRFRRTTRVVGSDEKTMLVESRTGNLARALKGAKR